MYIKEVLEMKKLIVVLILMMIIVGCETQSEIEASKEFARNQEISTTACINQGGVPIYSSWDNRLKDCRFKKGE
jgi:PBP1b-binding outer membrane lipoprotein LpoB